MGREGDEKVEFCGRVFAGSCQYSIIPSHIGVPL
jgi:hypothetical protein